MLFMPLHSKLLHHHNQRIVRHDTADFLTTSATVNAAVYDALSCGVPGDNSLTSNLASASVSASFAADLLMCLAPRPVDVRVLQTISHARPLSSTATICAGVSALLGRHAQGGKCGTSRPVGVYAGTN